MTADDLQVRAPRFAPQHARAIVLTAFCSSLLQKLLEDGLHGPCDPIGSNGSHGTVFRRRGERAFLSIGAGDAVAALAVIACA